MEKSRYVVEYLAEGQDDVQSMFVEADSVETATQCVVDRFGAFTTILSSQLTKSCGGSGATQTATKVTQEDTAEPDFVAEEPSIVEVVKPKKEKVTAEKPVKEKKVTNASRIRVKAAEVKSVNGTPLDVVTWAIETLGMAKGMANSYVKVIWNE